MDSFNLIAGLCSILSFFMAAYDWARRKRKASRKQKGRRESYAAGEGWTAAIRPAFQPRGHR